MPPGQVLCRPSPRCQEKASRRGNSERAQARPLEAVPTTPLHSTAQAKAKERVGFSAERQRVQDGLSGGEPAEARPPQEKTRPPFQRRFQRIEILELKIIAREAEPPRRFNSQEAGAKEEGNLDDAKISSAPAGTCLPAIACFGKQLSEMCKKSRQDSASKGPAGSGDKDFHWAALERAVSREARLYTALASVCLFRRLPALALLGSCQ